MSHSLWQGPPTAALRAAAEAEFTAIAVGAMHHWTGAEMPLPAFGLLDERGKSHVRALLRNRINTRWALAPAGDNFTTEDLIESPEIWVRKMADYAARPTLIVGDAAGRWTASRPLIREWALDRLARHYPNPEELWQQRALQYKAKWDTRVVHEIYAWRGLHALYPQGRTASMLPIATVGRGRSWSEDRRSVVAHVAGLHTLEVN